MNPFLMYPRQGADQASAMFVRTFVLTAGELSRRRVQALPSVADQGVDAILRPLCSSVGMAKIPKRPRTKLLEGPAGDALRGPETGPSRQAPLFRDPMPARVEPCLATPSAEGPRSPALELRDKVGRVPPPRSRRARRCPDHHPRWARLDASIPGHREDGRRARGRDGDPRRRSGHPRRAGPLGLSGTPPGAWRAAAGSGSPRKRCSTPSTSSTSMASISVRARGLPLRSSPP